MNKILKQIEENQSLKADLYKKIENIDHVKNCTLVQILTILGFNTVQNIIKAC
jgi:hypothetical protein